MAKGAQRRSPYLNVAIDFGYMLLASVLILGGLGYWLDQRRGAAVPWLTIVGVLLGIATAFRSLVRRLSALEQAEREAGQGRRPPDQGEP